MKKKYLYVVIAELNEKPFTTKSKKELVEYFGEIRTAVVEKWFGSEGWIVSHKGSFVSRFEIPIIESKGKGRGSNLTSK